jgi:uncharacterized protein YndB with AHSA1/START domain
MLERKVVTMATDDLKLTQIPPVKVGMLIHRPPRDVFQALVDPAITTRFWFTKSSGRLAPGARVQWEWEFYGVSTQVSVKELDEDSRILMEWGDGEDAATVEFRFVGVGEDGTYVQVTESGLSGDGDAIVARVAGSTGGFSLVLCALKALLEHDIVLTVVRDRFPKGVEI